MKLVCCITALLLLAPLAGAKDVAKTEAAFALGGNADLREGADQLRLGDPELGIRLTRSGLLKARDAREQYMAYSNLCAGYILVRDLDQAVRYCNLALQLNDRNHHALSNRALARFYQEDYDGAREDADAGLLLAPYSSSLKRVRQMIEDQINPVTPTITIEHGQPRDEQ